MMIRDARTGDVEACVAVLVALPDYFTPSTHDEVRREFPGGAAWVAEDDGEIVGFVLVEQRYPTTAEIVFAAVRRERHRRGIGSRLVETCLAALDARDVQYVEVKTLDARAGYEPYVATRAFWERHGFVQIDCIDPLPGWDAGNPAAVYVRGLR
jgi:ribosomal protein S18 acetylase RimI-like enzyme